MGDGLQYERDTDLTQAFRDGIAKRAERALTLAEQVADARNDLAEARLAQQRAEARLLEIEAALRGDALEAA